MVVVNGTILLIHILALETDLLTRPRSLLLLLETTYNGCGTIFFMHINIIETDLLTRPRSLLLLLGATYNGRSTIPYPNTRN